MYTEETYFNFRVIECPDGSQIIDERLKTPLSALSPLAQLEYKEIDVQLDRIARLKRREQREKERMQKLARNPFYRLACFCGMV